ncbi:MAG TPA: ligase-associated DNA damage response exonuclease [Dongiaceae bacterium]|nr:ligase-associated DNA damage response exonuclease [Dongiaceae bacterium]
MPLHPQHWLRPMPGGLYCEPGGFFIDPSRPVDRAMVTHGHGDHARAGHGKVAATAETLAIMGVRYGDGFARETQALAYGERLAMGGVTIMLEPAGHILGSAQVVLEHGGCRAVVSGDYKRRFDPTCPPFTPVKCDVFITEATFGLPVFRHPPDKGEIAKVLHARELFPDRSVLIGVYALGKCQRVIGLLRRAGYDRPIYLHGALQALTQLYESRGVALGPTASVAGMVPAQLKSEIVLCPPSAIGEVWSRRMGDPVPAVASGWMRIRARARQARAELPLIISDHCDWDELLATVRDVDAPEVWVTHGREEALIHAIQQTGRKARALSLVGYEDEE